LPANQRRAHEWVESVSEDALLERRAALGSARLPSATLELAWLDLFESRASQHPAVLPVRMTIADPAARLDKLNVMHGGYRDQRVLRCEVEDGSESASGIDVSFEPGGALIGEQRGVELQTASIARETPLRWAAWRRGSAPVFGDESAFARAKNREDVARLRFEPGWGAVLWCRATDGVAKKTIEKLKALGYAGDAASPPLHEILAAPPLPSVRVLVDGTLGGTSDEEGVVRLATKTLPARLVLVAEHWHMKSLERLPQRCAATQRYVVWMERD